MGKLTGTLNRQARVDRRLGDGISLGTSGVNGMDGTGKANRTNVSNVYDVLVTKAGSSKVGFVFGWNCNYFTNGGCGQE